MRFFYHQIYSLLGNTAAKTGPKNTLFNLIPNEEFSLKKHKAKQIKTPFNLHYASGIFLLHALKFHLPPLHSITQGVDGISKGKQLFLYLLKTTVVRIC